MFSLTLGQIDTFLGSEFPSQPLSLSDPVKPHPSKTLSSYTSSQPRTYIQDQRLALQQMNKELHLAVSTSQEELKAY